MWHGEPAQYVHNHLSDEKCASSFQVCKVSQDFVPGSGAYIPKFCRMCCRFLNGDMSIKEDAVTRNITKWHVKIAEFNKCICAACICAA